MKVVIEFDLDNPDDVFRHKRMINAEAAWNCLFALDGELRKNLKYGGEWSQGTGDNACDKVRSFIRGCVDDGLCFETMNGD